MGKARWEMSLVTAGMLAFGLANPASAQTGDKFSENYKSRAEDIEAVLRYVPRQEGVDYTKPSPEELKACTMKLIVGEGGRSGWLLLDPQGRPLRRFFDTTGKKRADGKTHSDTWSYYKDGVEVYREIDTRLNDKPDHFRWFNSGGSRWGIDLNEDGKIDTWKVISAEEAAQEAYLAVATRDFARLKALFITEQELLALRLPAGDTARMRDSLGRAQSTFQDTCIKAVSLTGKAQLKGVEVIVPHCIPADPFKGPPQDVLRFPSRQILYEGADTKPAWLQTNEMIQVGQAWRLVGSPTLNNGDSYVIPENGPPLSLLADKLTKALESMGQSPPFNPTPGKYPAVVDYYTRRVALLEQICAEVKDENLKETWTRQILDNLSTAHQANVGGDGKQLAKLQQWKDKIVKSSPGSNLAGYAFYRELWARYAADIAGVVVPGSPAPDPVKVQREWNEELAKFVAAYPKAEDTPDALLQLAMYCEFGNKEKEAKQYYGLIVSNFPDNPLAPKAAGAKERLDLNGKLMKLSGPTLDGAQFNVSRNAGKVTVVYYWAKDCKVCVGDFAMLKQLHATYGAKGLEIVDINLDETPEAARQFLQSNPLPGTHLFYAVGNAKGLESPLATQYGIMGLPTIILVGKDGRVINRSIQINELEDAVKKAQ